MTFHGRAISLRLLKQYEEKLSSTYLVCHYGSRGSSCVRSYDDAAVENAANDGGSGAGGLGQRHSASMESPISLMMTEVEARHDGDAGSSVGHCFLV